MNNIKKVLVIDDEQAVVDVVSEFLKWEDYDVLSATTGLEGIRINDKENPDLIILDLRMPGLSGIDALRQIRKTDKDVRVVILSGYLSDDVCADMAGLDVNTCLRKPFDSDTLYQTIENINTAHASPEATQGDFEAKSEEQK